MVLKQMYLYPDPEMQFFQSMEAVEYITEQLGWNRVAEDLDFLETDLPEPALEATVEFQQ